MFDLDNAIESWRTRIDWQKGISETDQYEMETHLREEIAVLIDTGLSPREAFFKAVRDFGHEAKLSKSFRKADWKEDYFSWMCEQPSLLGNYLNMALRQMWRDKGYSLINILGLAIGITCSMLILLFIQDELSYDRFHENADRIYRVVHGNNARSSTAIGPALAETFPEVEAYTRIRGITSIWMMTTKTNLFMKNRCMKLEKISLKCFPSSLSEVIRRPHLRNRIAWSSLKQQQRRYSVMKIPWTN